MIGRLVAAALACAFAFVVLAWWVSHHPLSRLDLGAGALRGSYTPLAIAFTTSGYGVCLTLLSALTIVAALVLRAPLALPIAIIVSQLLSQAVVNALKNVIGRARPDVWLYRHELGLSYPSGHATTAVVFYGTWLIVAWLSPLPVATRVVCVTVLAIWILGIGWSRLALGAHYPTDVIGGYLFGAAWLCLSCAVFIAYASRFDLHLE